MKVVEKEAKDNAMYLLSLLSEVERCAERNRVAFSQGSAEKLYSKFRNLERFFFVLKEKLLEIELGNYSCKDCLL